MLRLVLFICLLCCFHGSAADSQYDEQQQLYKLAHLIGGKWWLGKDSYQEYEWGLGRTQIKMKRVLVDGNSEKVVTEGFFYYSPDSFSIKGICTLQIDTENPQLLEYFGTVTDDKHEFVYRSISPDSSVKIYSEVWVKTGKNSYRWTLEPLDDESAVVTGTYTREH